MTAVDTGALDAQASRGAQGGRLRLVALAAILGTFVAGGAVGYGVGRHTAAAGGDGPGPRATAHAAAPNGGDRDRRRGMYERLHLTPAQQQQVDSIFASRRGQMEAFWAGPGRQLRAILDSTSADVRAVLDSSQRVTFDSIRAARERREKEMRARGGFPGGPPFGAPRGDSAGRPR